MSLMLSTHHQGNSLTFCHLLCDSCMGEHSEPHLCVSALYRSFKILLPI